MINVALAKGRLAEKCADIFIKCGIRAEILKEETRKLVLETADKKFKFFFVKPSDVPTYVNTAKRLYFSRGEDVEIIKLNGSIELAPLTGLSDVIFDIVQSGGTLRANGLEVLEEVFDISARLIANKVSLKTKADEILPLIGEMKKYV